MKRCIEKSAAIELVFIDTSGCSRATAIMEMHVVVYGPAILRSLINLHRWKSKRLNFV